MITEEQAKERILAMLRARGVGGEHGVVILEPMTIVKPYGWAFFYNARRFVETGDILQSLVGAGPIVVLAAGGEIHELGSARPALDEIRDLEKRLGLSN